jgi:hypothetical protein
MLPREVFIMARTALTALAVQKIKRPSSKTDRVEKYDAIVRGFGVRVTPEGSRSWIFVYQSPKTSKRRRYTIGAVEFDKPDGKTTFDLEQARAKAHELRHAVKSKRDPADEREQAEAAEEAKAEEVQSTTFKAVAETYKARELGRKRRGSEMGRIIDRQLIPHWGERAIGDITAIDVERRILALVNAGKPEAARKLMEVIRQIFDWAMAHPSYRLERSPADRMNAIKLIGKKVKRKRVLSDDELCAAWRAAERVGYPFGPFVKTLMLTALRRNEAAEASRSEFDIGRKLWTIPAERMKGEEDESGPHVVPLSGEMLKILEDLPRFGGGDFLFTSGNGAEPISGFSKMKGRFDKLMLEELRKIAEDRQDKSLLARIGEIESVMAKLAKARGEDRRQYVLELKRIWFVLHDVRRSVRTHLSALPVPELVRELVLAHAKPELHKIYDQWSYLDEKRQALDLWAARLMRIVDPPADNVVALRA